MKLLLYKWTFDQLNTFFLTFVQISAEVHLYRSNFLENPYFRRSFTFWNFKDMRNRDSPDFDMIPKS